MDFLASWGSTAKYSCTANLLESKSLSTKAKGERSDGSCCLRELPISKNQRNLRNHPIKKKKRNLHLKPQKSFIQMIVHTTRLYLKPKAFQIFLGIDSNRSLSTDLKSMPLKLTNTQSLVCGKALRPSYQVLINIPWRVT